MRQRQGLRDLLLRGFAPDQIWLELVAPAVWALADGMARYPRTVG
ncbi:hypothetical protein [Spirillospora sp. CA-128828]